jgi:hypothetical protein
MAQVMGCACSSCGIEGRGMCAKFWSGNLKKRLFRRPSYKWEHNLKVDLKEMRWSVWTRSLIQNRCLWWACKHFDKR